MNGFINTIFVSPIGYNIKHIYKIKTHTCINVNETNSKKWCIATVLRYNKKKTDNNKCYTAVVLTAQSK